MLFIVAADHTARGHGRRRRRPAGDGRPARRCSSGCSSPWSTRGSTACSPAPTSWRTSSLLGALDDRVAVGHDEPRRAGRRHAGSSTTGSPPTTPSTSSPPTSTPARCCCASTADDPGTVPTLEACARAVGELNDRRMHGDGRADPVHQGRRAAEAVWDDDPAQLVAGRRRLRRPRRLVGLHVAEDPGHRPTSPRSRR